MSYSIKATLNCNGRCRSCYEDRIRREGGQEPDIDKIIDRLNRIIERKGASKHKSHPPTLHGGEPLILPPADLERLMAVIYRHWRSNTIQTNGLLITDEIISLFKKYNTSVGVSIDGDTAQLNRGRWNAEPLMSDEVVQGKTDLTLANLKRCSDAGLRVSIITVLRKYNAAPDRIARLLEFFSRLHQDYGVNHIRTNPGIVYGDYNDEELTPAELALAFVEIAKFDIQNPGLQTRPFHDVVDLMFGYYGQTCLFNHCDPFHTRGEQAINYNGDMSNCLKAGPALDGIQAIQTGEYTDIRAPLLQLLPQSEGGCAECKYWHLCGGLCPGEGIDNDWRNRSRFCEGYMALFKYVHTHLRGLFPGLNFVPDYYPDKPLYQDIIKPLVAGNGTYKKKPMARTSKTSASCPVVNSGHGDSHGDSHGDCPHGDHGDAR